MLPCRIGIAISDCGKILMVGRAGDVFSQRRADEQEYQRLFSAFPWTDDKAGETLSDRYIPISARTIKPFSQFAYEEKYIPVSWSDRDGATAYTLLIS